MVHDDLDVLAGQLTDRGHEVVLVPGQEPAVQRRGGGLRDHVHLVARVQHRERRRVGQRPEDEAGRPTEVTQHRGGVVRRIRGAGEVAEPVEQRPDRGDVLARPGVCRDPADRLGQPHDGVGLVGHRPVPGSPAGVQPKPRDPLLRGLDEVGAGGLPGPGARHGDAEAADLRDRLGHPLEPVAVLVDDPPAALQSARLLVGEEHERRRPRRLLTGPREVAQVGDDHRVHVLHVDGPAPPDAAVALLAGERVHLPVGGVRRDDVEMTVHGEAGTRGVGPLDPDHHRRSARLALDEHGVQTHLGELVHDVLGGLAFPWARPVAVVDRLDPDQVGADARDFVFGSDGGVLEVVHRPTLRPLCAGRPP